MEMLNYMKNQGDQQLQRLADLMVTLKLMEKLADLLYSGMGEQMGMLKFMQKQADQKQENCLGLRDSYMVDQRQTLLPQVNFVGQDYKSVLFVHRQIYLLVCQDNSYQTQI